MAWSRLRAAVGCVLLALGACQSASTQEGLFRPERFTHDEALQTELRALTELGDAEPLGGPAWRIYGERLAAAAERWPDAVQVQRRWDDFRRANLRGPEVWVAREAVHAERKTGADAYLLGRLELPERAERLFDEATNLAPQFAMGFHGSAWLQSQAGKPLASEPYGKRAAARATSLEEALTVGRALARFRQQAGLHEQARELLAELLELPGLAPREAARLRALAVASKLQFPRVSVVMSLNSNGGNLRADTHPVGGPRSTRADWLQALDLLASDSGLADADVPGLVQAIDAANLSRPRAEKLAAVLIALAGRTGPQVERLRSGLERELEAASYGQLLAPGPGAAGTLDGEQFEAALAFEQGRAGEWLATWRRRLPTRLRGLGTESETPPGEPFMTAAVSALANDPALVRQPGSGALIEQLFAAGWFEAASELELRGRGSSAVPLTRIEAGRLLVAELVRLMDEGFAGHLKGLGGERGFLAAAAELAARFVPMLDPAVPELVSSAAIRDSSRESYGPLASLVQPGPREAAAPDAAQLPGLAALTAALGRMAVVGVQLGKLDATMRPVIARQYLAGEHLGAPFSGTAFWCQGVDAPSRAERSGAGIAGAAVHDGFWIDIEVVRGIAESWQRIGVDYAALLAAPGDLFPRAPVCGPGRASEHVPLLGEGRRLMLTLIAERGPASFDELLQLIQIHEQAHLCDRARFLPLTQNWPAALALLAKVNFQPEALMQRLEYRAELVTLCEADDPRLVLTEILNMAESAEAAAGSQGTPHGKAYAALLDDLEQLAAEHLDSQRYLRWQWHRVDPDLLRELALELARREGLVEE